jgi:hypothetical protein
MLKYQDTLVLYDNSIDYFNPYFENKGISVQSTFSEVPLYSRVIKVIFRFLKLSQAHWYADWKKRLSSTKTVIFFAPQKKSKVLEYIKKSNQEIRIIYWYWNPAFRSGIPSFQLTKIAELWSFDPDDCRRYSMMFNTTFYFNNILLPESIIEFDVVFVGINKGRKAHLQEIEKVLNKNGLYAYFHIVPESNPSKRIPYGEYLKLISSAKAIVDVKPMGQAGLTLRPMESIFLKKKLITNDISISSHDFYNSQNIFIIGKDREEDLKKFIDSPYVDLDTSIVEKYDVNSWLERFNSK